MFTLWAVNQVHNIVPRKKDLHKLECSCCGFHDMGQLEENYPQEPREKFISPCPSQDVHCVSPLDS